MTARTRAFLVPMIVAGVVAGAIACASTDAVAPRPDPTPVPPAPPPAAPSVARIVVSSETATLRLGDTLTVRAIAVDSLGNAITGTALSWTSSAPTIVTVSSQGMLTAKQGGTATITVASGTVSARIAASVSMAWRAAYASAWNGHTCALRSDSTAFCWGDNSSGQTGTGLPDSVISHPTVVAGAVKFTQLALSGSSTCALAVDGAAYCWGANEYGELGDGTTTPRATPAPVQTQERFVALSAGMSHICGLTAAGAAYCWGWNSVGQLGVSSPTDLSRVPVQVQSSQPFTALAAGGGHTCGLVADGGAYCWGWNQNAQSGAARGSAQYWEPAPAAPGLRFVSIAAGFESSCGVLADGRLACWGSNVIVSSYSGPQIVELAPPSLTTVVSGDWVPCVLWVSGGATCWGFASGTHPPQDVPIPTKIASITAGQSHACAVTSQGELYCWGSNASGQLGTGSVGGSSAAPVQVAEP